MWKIISEFKKFALRGNVVDLAVGFTVGVAFTTKKCPYCLSTIPHKASRCPECTSHLEPVRQTAS